MRPERWWTVILTMGLFMALSPTSAQAGPNRPIAPQPNRQAFTPPQPRGHVNNFHSQPHHWQQPPGQAYGWHGQNRQWHQPYGHAYGWNGHQAQWDQHRNAYGRNDHQWQQPPNGGQHHNPRSYNRAAYPARPQSPNIVPHSAGYSHNNTLPAGQSDGRPNFRHRDAGNAPLPQDPTPEGVI